MRSIAFDRPLPLEVTVAEEITIQQNMDTFEANGFRFEVHTQCSARRSWPNRQLTHYAHSLAQVDPQAVPGHQLRLKSLPFSKSTTFGVEDVHELVGGFVCC